MQRADAAGIGFDPRHRVGTGLDTGAHVELQHQIVRSVGGDDLDGPRSLQRPELGIVIVIAGTETFGLEVLLHMAEGVGDLAVIIQSFNLAGARQNEVVSSEDMVQFNGVRKARRREGVHSIVRRVAAHAGAIEDGADFFRPVRRPRHIRRVELHHLVAHLPHRLQSTRQVFREIVAHRIKFEADRNAGTLLGCKGHGESRGRDEERAARNVIG